MSARDKAIEAVVVIAGGSALAAKDAGQRYYTPELGAPSGIAKGLGLDLWALQLEAIEAAGWHLVTWHVDNGKGRPLFRLATVTP